LYLEGPQNTEDHVELEIKTLEYIGGAKYVGFTVGDIRHGKGAQTYTSGVCYYLQFLCGNLFLLKNRLNYTLHKKNWHFNEKTMCFDNFHLEKKMLKK